MNIIKGKWVLLREMEESDAPLVVSWRNRPDVAQWLIQWKPLTIEAHLQWFDKARANGDQLLIFMDNINDRPLGTGSLYNINQQNASAEWGRLCFEEKIRNPFAVVEGCYLVQRMGFAILGLKELYCGCAANNKSANKLYTYIGYVKKNFNQKALKTPRGSLDVIEYGMTFEDFKISSEKLEKKFYKEQKPPAFYETQINDRPSHN